jgi:hypothetical protein
MDSFMGCASGNREHEAPRHMPNISDRYDNVLMRENAHVHFSILAPSFLWLKLLPTPGVFPEQSSTIAAPISSLKHVVQFPSG